MARLRGFDRNVGSFEVTDFADHDDVRILPEKRLEGDRKREAGLVVDIDLVDAGQLNFRRVFRGGNVDARLIENVEARIQRYRLATAGGAGHQDHSVRPAYRGKQCFLLIGLIAQGFDTKFDAGGIENPHHDFFAVERGQRRHAKIDRFALRQHHLHAPVLRHAFFGDVEARDHLDTRCNLILDGQRRLRDLHQDSVDPIAYAEIFLVGLEMYIGSTCGDCVHQDFLQVLDDWRVLDVRVVVERSLRCAIFEGDLHVLEVGHVLQRGATALDRAQDRLAELVVFDDDGFGYEIGLESHLFHRLQVGGVGDGDEQLVAAFEQREHTAGLRDLDVDEFLGDLVGVETGEIEQRRAKCTRCEHGELVRCHALADQHLLDKRDVGRLRLRLQRFRLVIGHQTVLRKRARKPTDGAGGGVRGHCDGSGPGVGIWFGRSWASKRRAEAGKSLTIPFA